MQEPTSRGRLQRLTDGILMLVAATQVRFIKLTRLDNQNKVRVGKLLLKSFDEMFLGNDLFSQTLIYLQNTRDRRVEWSKGEAVVEDPRSRMGARVEEDEDGVSGGMTDLAVTLPVGKEKVVVG